MSTAFTGLSLVIDSAIYTFEHLTGFGVLLEVVRILTLLALPGLTAFAALQWSNSALSTRLSTIALLVCFGVPLLMLADDAPMEIAANSYRGTRFIADKDAILTVLSRRHGVPEPHP